MKFQTLTFWTWAFRREKHGVCFETWAEKLRAPLEAHDQHNWERVYRGRRACREDHGNMASHLAVRRHSRLPRVRLQRLAEGASSYPTHRRARARPLCTVHVYETPQQAVPLGRREPFSLSQPSHQRSTRGLWRWMSIDCGLCSLVTWFCRHWNSVLGNWYCVYKILATHLSDMVVMYFMHHN